MSATRRFGLFPKYAIVLVSLVAVTVLVGGAVEMVFNYADSREAITALQRSEARGAAVRIEQFLAGVQAQIAEVAGLPWTNDVLGAKERRAEYLRLLKIVPAISEISQVDGDGRARVKVSRIELDEIASGKQAASPLLLEAARKNGVAFSATYFQEGSEPFVSLGVREGDGAAFTVAELNLKFVGDVVGRMHVGEAGRVYVLDSANRLVAHPNPSLTLRGSALSDLPFVQQVRDAVRVSSEAGGIEGQGVEGTRVIASTVRIPIADWLVVVEQPRAEVLAPVYRSLVRIAILVAAGLLAALAASYVLARRLSRPIIELRHGAERIGRGDLTSRIDVKTGDEIEALATEFNSMAAQLQEYTTGLERMVAEKTAELQAALRAKAVFLAAASHDLRQPLYAISILADALSLEELPPSAIGALDKQRQAIAVLRTLFDNLLDLSRFDAGDIRPALRNVALRDALAPLAAEYEVVCKEKRLAWSYEVADVRVRTDPELLRRLVGNLLSNAVRYTESGSVRLTAKKEAGRAIVEIVDTGIGIAPADQAHVFDEFVQVGNPSRERDKGVGLGLSIVRKIDALLGTRLALASALGSGTRVTLELAVAEDAAPSVPQHAEAEALDLVGVRLWVVEDDPLVREALAAQFDAWDIDHAFAANRSEIDALHRKDGTWPDAAILDDMLESGERGLDIARWLALHMPMERIVFVTGNVDPERLRLLEESGFRVMRKPIATAELGQWLARAVRSSPVAAP